jgi:hypothetical protein
MPARKPAGLRNRAETKAEKAERIANEAALEPERGLSVQAPARLKDHPVAGAAWRRLMRTYGQLKATIVTRMDMDLLVDYCILMEQVGELDELRAASFAAWKKLDERWTEIEGEFKGKDLLTAFAQLQSAFTDVIKLDGRVDRKRAFLLQLRQSLYLTPRARAAAVPAKKEKPIPPDELEQLLDDVEDSLNHESQQ